MTEVVRLESLVTKLGSVSSSLCAIHDPKIRTELIICLKKEETTLNGVAFLVEFAWKCQLVFVPVACLNSRNWEIFGKK